MTFSIEAVCFLVALILFILSVIPVSIPVPLSSVGLAFLAAGLLAMVL